MASEAASLQGISGNTGKLTTRHCTGCYKHLPHISPRDTKQRFQTPA
jgi:hypothetical protein